MRQPHANPCRRCFSLVELTFAAAILVFSASGIYAACTLSTWLITSSRYHLEAQSVAVDHCWANYRKDYTALLAMPSVTTSSVPSTNVLATRGGTIRTAVIPYADHVTIAVRVDWAEKNNRGASENFTVNRYDDR